MRRDRGIWKVESGEGLRALEKTRFLCPLKGGEGQGPSRCGLGPGLSASESLTLPPCSACCVLPSTRGRLALSAMALYVPALEWMPAESCCSLLVCASAPKCYVCEDPVMTMDHPALE